MVENFEVALENAVEAGSAFTSSKTGVFELKGI